MFRGFVVLATLLTPFQNVCASERLAVPKGQFELEWQDEFSDREQQRIRNWLSYSAESRASSVVDSQPQERGYCSTRRVEEKAQFPGLIRYELATLKVSRSTLIPAKA